MATTNQTIKYRLRQLNNANNNAHLLWFPKVERTDTLSQKGITKHIAGHGTVYTRDVVDGVLTKFRDCLIEKLTEGVAVKLDGLGTFYPTMESKGAESPVGYNVRDYIKGLHIRFQPEGATEDNITSRVLKQNVRFQQMMIFDKLGVPKKVVDGQLVDYGDDDEGGDDDNNQGGGTNDNGGGNG